MAKNLLVEKWAPLIESKKAKKVTNKEQMAQVLENQENYITEAANTVAADVAQYTPILVPAVRRVFPNLLANEIVGVQPMQTPVGYAYALRYAYGLGAGQTADAAAKFNRGATITNPNKFGSYAVVLDANLGAGNTALFVDDGSGGSQGTKLGDIVYIEGNKALVNAVTPGVFPAVGSHVETTGGTPITGAAVTFIANNEAGFNLIFKNYVAAVTTAAGESLTLKAGGTMASMKMSLERVAIEAQTRKLGAEYTIELAQDLKAIHGLDAEGELINILEYEITAELDRVLVGSINSAAKAVVGWVYASDPTAVPALAADGRWEQERFRTLYTKIVKESNMIALTSRRGAGNFIICSTNVVTALEALPNFMYSAVPGNVTTTFGVAKVGTLDGRFAVYMDTFAVADYVTVGYKGPSQFDTGIIYCPYVPLQLHKVTDPETFQPKLGFMTRDAIAGNLWGAENYYRTFSVNFTGSTLVADYPSFMIGQ